MAFLFSNIEQQLGGNQPNIFGGGGQQQQQPTEAGGGTGSLAKTSNEGAIGGSNASSNASSSDAGAGVAQNQGLLSASQNFTGSQNLAPVKAAQGAIKSAETNLQNEANAIAAKSPGYKQLDDSILTNVGKDASAAQQYKDFMADKNKKEVEAVNFSTDATKPVEALKPLQSANALASQIRGSNKKLTSGQAAYNASVVQNSPEFQNILRSLGTGAGSIAGQKSAAEQKALADLTARSNAEYGAAKTATQNRAKEIYGERLSSAQGAAGSARAAEEAAYNKARDKFRMEYDYGIQEARGRSPDAAQFIESLGLPASFNAGQFNYGGTAADFYTPEQIAELNAYGGVIGESAFDPGQAGGSRTFDPGEYAKQLELARRFQPASAPAPYQPVNFEPAAQSPVPQQPVPLAQAGQLAIDNSPGDFTNINRNIKPLPRSQIQERINPNVLSIYA